LAVELPSGPLAHRREKVRRAQVASGVRLIDDRREIASVAPHVGADGARLFDPGRRERFQ
jgi:hypothetical protein